MAMNILLTLLLIAVVILLIGQLGLLRGQAPHDLGVRNGQLKPLPATPNAVSSQYQTDSAASARVEPLSAKGLDAAAAMNALAEHLRDTPGLHVVTQRADYIYVQAQTQWLKFVDDMEFWYDANTQTIAVRSASRLGRSDLGANRKRVQAIRDQWSTIAQGVAKAPLAAEPQPDQTGLSEPASTSGHPMQPPTMTITIKKKKV
jgi:uncharacterized protein (DUF1499 family)